MVSGTVSLCVLINKGAVFSEQHEFTFDGVVGDSQLSPAFSPWVLFL